MKTAELTGAQLDYWVAQSDPSRGGIRWERQGNDWIGFGRIGSSPEFACWIVTDASSLHERSALRDTHPSAVFYEPSKDWVRGGQIIDRESIYFEPSNFASAGKVFAYVDDGHECPPGQFGDTRLIAAMRAYVTSKFGDEVPDDDRAAQAASHDTKGGNDERDV